MGAIDDPLGQPRAATPPQVVRIPLPTLTEERRKELTKVITSSPRRHATAFARVRRDANDRLKLLKDSSRHLGRTHERRGLDEVQKLTTSMSD